LFHVAVVVLVSVSVSTVNAFAPSATSTATRSTRLVPLLLAQQNNNNNNNNGVDKGFNLLETASKFVPQGRIVQTAKESWKFVWKVSLKLYYIRVVEDEDGMEWSYKVNLA
jgi:hypothetical protein